MKTTNISLEELRQVFRVLSYIYLNTPISRPEFSSVRDVRSLVALEIVNREEGHE